MGSSFWSITGWRNGGSIDFDHWSSAGKVRWSNCTNERSEPIALICARGEKQGDKMDLALIIREFGIMNLQHPLICSKSERNWTQDTGNIAWKCQHCIVLKIKRISAISAFYYDLRFVVRNGNALQHWNGILRQYSASVWPFFFLARNFKSICGLSRSLNEQNCRTGHWTFSAFFLWLEATE